MPKRRDPSYYVTHRQLRISLNLCSKCKNKLFKAGLCKKHYKANRDRRRKAYLYNQKVSRYNRCGICNEFRHSRPTCPYMKAIPKRDRHRFLSWQGPQTKP